MALASAFRSGAAPARRRAGLAWLAALPAAALALVPLAFTVAQATGAGYGRLGDLLLRPRTLELALNTAKIVVAVTVLCVVLGVGAAWSVERLALPGRRVWATLLALPLAVPEFVASYGWVSIAPSLQGFSGAVLVMSLSLYPLVYLPALAGLRSADPAPEEVARSLGLGAWRTFARVTLVHLRPAVVGGALLVSLYLLAEYGAFALLRYQTFATEIFTQYRLAFDPAIASGLSLVLIVASLGLLTAGSAVSRPAAWPARRGAARTPARRRPGVAAGAGLAALVLAVAGGLAVPLGALGYWLVRGGTTTLPPASILGAAGSTLVLAATAAALTCALALPVALLGARRRGRLSAALEAATFVPRGLPGVAVALAFVFFAVRSARALYQSPVVLVAAYAVLFLPLAVVALRAAAERATPALDEVARSLGARPPAVLARVVLPLLAPGLGAAFALVFLSVATELTATLLLRPTGTETLATRFWAYTTNLSYGAAAPYAALLVLLSALPTVLLLRNARALLLR